MPALAGRAVVAALERPASKWFEPRDRIISCGTAMIPTVRLSYLFIGTISHPGRFAPYCGKRASPEPDFLIFSEQPRPSFVEALSGF
jgi:hypothetical protein